MKIDPSALLSSGLGLLPFRGSLMLDVVFIAMFAIIPILGVSIWLAKSGRFWWHRTLQLSTSIVLLLAVVAFEIDMRFFTDWRQLAADSQWVAWCPSLLYIHLCFAVPTPLLWAWIIFQAMRKFDDSFQNPAYRQQHRRLGWIGVTMMLGTGLTGIVFYIFAFVL